MNILAAMSGAPLGTAERPTVGIADRPTLGPADRPSLGVAERPTLRSERPSLGGRVGAREARKGRTPSPPQDARPSVSALLVRRNREIAEVREDLQKAEAKLETLQVSNKDLLEQRSLFDSEISGHSNRAAAAEMKLAELFDQEQSRSEQLAEQNAEHRREVDALKREQDARKERLEQSKLDKAAAKTRGDDLEAQLRKLQEELDERALAQDAVRRQRDDHRRRVSSTGGGGAAIAVEREIENQLATIDLRRSTHMDEAAFARRRVTSLGADHAAERKRREDLNKQLQDLVAQHSEDPGRVQALEAAVAQRGGCATTLLRAAADGGHKHDDGESDRMVALQSELRASEDEVRTLRENMEKERQRDSDKAERLQRELDDARQKLQSSLQDASDAHTSQVTMLEERVQAERQRMIAASLSENACADLMMQLQKAKANAREQESEDARGATADASQAARLENELQQVRQEIGGVEQMYRTACDQGAVAEGRRRQAEITGVKSAAKLRHALEDLWKGLRSARLRVETPHSPATTVFNPPNR